MSTKTLFGTELKQKLLDGILKLNASVSSTLGPGGRNVLINEADGTIKATKDGVSVAKSFHKLDDDIENIGAQLVKQVAIKSANEAGDGTTTSTLLATVMIEEGMKLIEKGTNVICKIGNDNNKINSLDIYQLDYDINKSLSYFSFLVKSFF